MAFLVTKKQPYTKSNGVIKYVVEARGDSVTEDVTPPDSSWYMGSLFLELSTGKIFGLDSDGEWIEQVYDNDERE